MTANALPLQSGSATVTVTSPRRRATVALSTVTANVATGSVTLRFGGALDAESVRDVSHYAVQVNGHSVRVESAGYNAAVYTVTLSLAEGALQVGDQVIVQWSDLTDAQGLPLSGQIAPLAVR